MRALPNTISVYSVVNSGAPHRRYLPLTDGELSLVAATAFTSELLLFSYHSATHNGLEGYYHHLLVLLIGLCVLATVLGELPCRPRHQHAHCAAGAVVLFYQTAFSLYGPMLPDGCVQDADGSVDYHSRAAEERAEQLANLQLFGPCSSPSSTCLDATPSPQRGMGTWTWRRCMATTSPHWSAMPELARTPPRTA